MNTRATRTMAWMVALLTGMNAHAAVSSVTNSLPRLGDPPPAPTTQMLQQLRQATPVIEGALGGFSVTTTNREEVRNFFNTVYAASENPLIGWTGDIATCVPGTTLAAFRDATALRINFFRAMAGLPADITFDVTNNTKDQHAALMMSANNELNHFPPTNWICYTTDGADAAGNSNLAIGNNGPDAIDAYIEDFGANNSVVGHRRWLVYPQTQIMGTGDVADNGTFDSANAVWVFDANFGGPRPATRDTFVSWPPPGFVPYQVVYPRWSFGLTNADFNSATVTMSTNGVNIPVTLETVSTGFGENTLVWYPSNLNPSAPFNWPRPAADTVYSVGVQNVIISGMSKSFNYTVTVFDPSVPGPDTVLPVITGNSSPTVNVPSTYMFTPVPNATGHQWRQAVRTSFTAVEGAESGLTFFTTNVSPGYAVIVGSPVASGSFAFHLAQPVAVDQILTYTRNLLPGAGSQLNFSSRLGTATSGQVANVQVSLDDGNSWNDIYSQPGIGGGGEGSYVARSVSLTNYLDRSITVRFRYAYTGGSFFPQTSTGVGWYLDNISFTGTEELTQPVSMTATNGDVFDFTPTLATNYALQARAQVYNAFFLEWGPAKRITAVSTPPPPNMPPVAVCRNVTTNANATCQQNVPVSAVDNGSSDPDGFIATSTLTPPGPYAKGAQQVVLTVTDNQGATASCTAIVTVVDNTLPVMTCTNLNVTVPAGQSNAVVDFTTPATDNCGSVTISCTVTSGATYNLGTNPVTCAAVDSSANTNTCNFNVIVQEAPPVPHDFAVVTLKAPKKITLSATTPSVAKTTKVSIQNRSPHTETITNMAVLINLVHLTVQTLGTNCPDAVVAITPPKAFPVVLAPKKKLTVVFSVIYNCANDPLANSKTSTGHEDYRSLATVNHAAIDGVADTHTADDNCPRPPLPGGVDPNPDGTIKDKGCGGKNPDGTLGAEVKTDVVVK